MSPEAKALGSGSSQPSHHDPFSPYSTTAMLALPYPACSDVSGLVAAKPMHILQPDVIPDAPRSPTRVPFGTGGGFCLFYFVLRSNIQKRTQVINV